MRKTKKTKHIDIDNSMLTTTGKGCKGVVKGNGVKYMVTKENLIWGGGYTMQYEDDVS